MVSISRSVVSYEKGSKSKRRYRNQKKKKERKKEKNTELKRGRRNVGTALGKKTKTIWNDKRKTRTMHSAANRLLALSKAGLRRCFVFQSHFFLLLSLFGAEPGVGLGQRRENVCNWLRKKEKKTNENATICSHLFSVIRCSQVSRRLETNGRWNGAVALNDDEMICQQRQEKKTNAIQIICLFVCFFALRKKRGRLLAVNGRSKNIRRSIQISLSNEGRKGRDRRGRGGMGRRRGRGMNEDLEG